MIVLEALNALYGDCLILRYSAQDGTDRLWVIDGGPKSEKVNGTPLVVWRDVLLPRLRELTDERPIPVVLGMVSHIDDDHINGLQKITQSLTAASPANPAEIVFQQFWFNSFDSLVGPTTAPAGVGMSNASPLSIANSILQTFDPSEVSAVIQSVGQGQTLAADIGTLGLKGNQPLNGLISARKGQSKIDIDGAKITILGPRQNSLEKLQKEWTKALSKPSKAAREAALLSLFLPDSKLDSAVANLSSIVVWVDVGGKTLLLTGDARGDHIVDAWKELGLALQPVKVDVLKLPHHGSERNNPERFLDHFEATHYIFSANGKYDNPDPPVIEAVVKKFGDRSIILHFTNADITWSEPYALEKTGTKVQTLTEMLSALRIAYAGKWSSNVRASNEKGVTIKLA